MSHFFRVFARVALDLAASAPHVDAAVVVSVPGCCCRNCVVAMTVAAVAFRIEILDGF